MGVVIFAGSFHGKSTAHRKKLGHDVEEAPPPNATNVEKWTVVYDEFKVVEAEWKKNRIPKDLKRRGELFTAMCFEAYASDVPILLSHYSEELETRAKKEGREVRFVLIDYMEMTERIKAMDEEPPVFRMAGAYGYAEKLARRNGNVSIYPTIEKAIASYR